MRPLLIRADAGQAMGTGHVMRCFALAQAAIDGGRAVHFLSSGLPESLAARLRSEGISIHSLRSEAGSAGDAGETYALCRELDADWLVMDGYHLGQAFANGDPRGAVSLLVIDDARKLAHLPAHLLLNQNLHARREWYANANRASLLLGPKYALLRREFRRLEGMGAGSGTGAGTEKSTGAAKRILVTLGGADATNMTEKALRAVVAVGALREVDVVMGASNPNRDKLRQFVAANLPAAELHVNVTTMAPLMARADVCICSGGSTVWELARMGVPALLGAIAPVEEVLIEAAVASGAFETFGRFEEATSEGIAEMLENLVSDRSRRGDMSLRGRALVDGLGCGRVLAAMTQSHDMGEDR